MDEFIDVRFVPAGLEKGSSANYLVLVRLTDFNLASARKYGSFCPIGIGIVSQSLENICNALGTNIQFTSKNFGDSQLFWGPSLSELVTFMETSGLRVPLPLGAAVFLFPSHPELCFFFNVHDSTVMSPGIY